MRFPRYAGYVACAVWLMLTGCDSSTVDERTLPNALDLPVVTLDEANHTVSAPGSYNIQAFVTTRGICTLPAQCGESFVIVSNVKGALMSSEGVYKAVLYTDNPTQFKKDSEYLFSVSITLQGQSETRTFSIIGFDEL